ncbi:MAG: phytanoyl-CoA dioxygenase family protein [Cyclobacteriaceae bacterium]
MKNKDLSLIHEFVSNFFPKLSPQEAWEKYSLSDEQLDFFQVQGYISGVKMLESDQVDKLNAELAEIADPKHPLNHLFYEFHSNQSTDPNAVLFHSLGHWRMTPGFHDILWNPAFTIPASQLLGDRAIRLWHDQLFCKPARHGGVVAWHQDYSYWIRTIKMQHLTCWTGLDDATTENGCLHYVPKSHKWELLKKPELAGDMEALMDMLSEEQKEQFKPIPIEMKKGYGSFHHPLLIHGSHENKSEYSRRAFVINVFADGTLSDTDDKLLANVPIIPKGEKIEGQFFPILFDPTKN